MTARPTRRRRRSSSCAAPRARKSLLWVGQDRTAKTTLRFFRAFGRERCAGLRFVCSDMWKPYLKVIAKKASAAVHVLDRFHIMTHMSKAIDEVRAKEAKRLKADGYEPVLKGTRYCLLERPEHLTDGQDVKLAELLRYNLRTVRAYLLKEDSNVGPRICAASDSAVARAGGCRGMPPERPKPQSPEHRQVREQEAVGDLSRWPA